MRGAPNSRATPARSPEVLTRQASRAIGHRRSPFESTAFFVVRGRGCPHAASRSPMKSTACRVIWAPGYPQPTPRRNAPPAHRHHRHHRRMHLPATGVECREASPILPLATHSPFASTAFRVDERAGCPHARRYGTTSQAPSPGNRTDDPRRISADQRIRRNVARHDGTRADHRVLADRHAADDRRPAGSHIVRPGWPSQASALFRRQVGYGVA